MTWTSLRVEPGDHRAAALAALFSAGAQGVQEDEECLVTHFPPGVDVSDVVAAVAAAAPGARWELGQTPVVDWSVAWRDHLSARPVGRLTIVPTWLAAGTDPARSVVIEPGMAFGTGDHPSTRGALRLLQREVRPGSVVADLGAGSGVLAIAAAKLGASRVFAVDVDPEALPNAESNSQANGVADRVHCLEGDASTLLPLLAPLDLIVANILSSVLVELLPVMRRAFSPGGTGRAVLAGILHAEAGSMRSACRADGWRVVAEDLEEGWWSVTVEAPASPKA